VVLGEEVAAKGGGGGWGGQSGGKERRGRGGEGRKVGGGDIRVGYVVCGWIRAKRVHLCVCGQADMGFSVQSGDLQSL
jgi:hypothetical protein